MSSYTPETQPEVKETLRDRRSSFNPRFLSCQYIVFGHWLNIASSSLSAHFCCQCSPWWLAKYCQLESQASFRWFKSTCSVYCQFQLICPTFLLKLPVYCSKATVCMLPVLVTIASYRWFQSTCILPVHMLLKCCQCSPWRLPAFRVKPTCSRFQHLVLHLKLFIESVTFLWTLMCLCWLVCLRLVACQSVCHNFLKRVAS